MTPKRSKRSNGSRDAKRPSTPPTAFETRAALRRWFERHHTDTTELVVRIFKFSSGRGGITYREALDEALCFGWIDGVRRSFDSSSYTSRFTPRRRGSHCSHVNIKRAHELKAAGQMHTAGIAAFEKRDESQTINYSYELNAASFPPSFEERFKASADAWLFFLSHTRWYQRHARFWVTSAKKEETRERRLAQLIKDSAARRRLARVMPGAKRDD